MNKPYKYKILEQLEQNILPLEDVKNYTRISTNNDDHLLESMINSAIQTAEYFMKTSIVRKVIEVECSNNLAIQLPLSPIIEIIKIEADGEEIDITDITIHGDTLHLAKYVECKNLKIIYAAGYAKPMLVPASIIQGLMAHITAMYDARGAAVDMEGIWGFYRMYRKVKF